MRLGDIKGKRQGGSLVVWGCVAWGMKRQGPGVIAFITSEPTNMRNTVTNGPWEDGSQKLQNLLIWRVFLHLVRKESLFFKRLNSLTTLFIQPPQEKELVRPSWFPPHFLEGELPTLCYHQLIKGSEKSPQRSFILLCYQSILKAISLEYSLEGLMDAEAETPILWPPDSKN